MRNRTGLTPNDISADVIQDAFDVALKEMSKHKPLDVYGFIPTVADQQDYAFPNGSNYQSFNLPWGGSPYSAPKVYRIKDVLYSNGITTTYPFFDKDFPITVVQDLFNVQFGGNVFESPTLARVLFAKLESFRDTFGTTFEIINSSPKKLRLFPPPTQAGVAAYYGSGSLTNVNQISEEDEEAFLKAVLWKVAEARAMSLAVVESMSDSGGMKLAPAHKFWNDKACEWQQDFLGDIGALAMPIAFG